MFTNFALAVGLYNCPFYCQLIPPFHFFGSDILSIREKVVNLQAITIRASYQRIIST